MSGTKCVTFTQNCRKILGIRNTEGLLYYSGIFIDGLLYYSGIITDGLLSYSGMKYK